MPVGFQPIGFQNNAFQNGYALVAADYSIGSPVFATPPLTSKYVLSVNSYSIGSPSFATPTLTTLAYVLHANAYSIGSPVFATPTLRQVNNLVAPNYTIGSPSFATPGPFTQNNFLFANSWSVGSPDFAKPAIRENHHLVAIGLDVGPLYWGDSPPTVKVNHVLKANDYTIGSPTFAFPRLVETPSDAPVYPLTYLTQLNMATDLVKGWVDQILASLPSPANASQVDVLRIGNALRANADAYLRGNNLGGAMATFVMAADKASAGYIGIDAARRFLLGHVGSPSEFVAIVMRGALVQTLSLEAKTISKMSFESQEEAKTMIAAVKKMFDEAIDAGIDLADDPAVFQSLIALSGALTNHLAKTALKLPRYVAWRSDMPMPSLYLANRIYADGSRYAEIERENDVVNPAFCPMDLKVLSDVGR